MRRGGGKRMRGRTRDKNILKRKMDWDDMRRGGEGGEGKGKR